MISIILITHNYGVFIDDCLNSILANNQSLIGEILIIDDSSNDDTFEKVKNYLNNSKIKYFLVNFKSLSKSYNYGVQKSKYDFISKIDADDLIDKSFIQNYFEELKKNKYDLIFGNLKIVDENLNFLRIKEQSKKFINSKFNYPVGGGTIYKKKILENIGGFDENIRYQDDYDFWLKINKIENIRIGTINNANYLYRMHRKNMSKNILKKYLTKIYVLLKNTL
tara:strand:+ start:4454 stop:5122 length:669 start_codon:yes stop_codon:yes gene_type:complete